MTNKVIENHNNSLNVSQAPRRFLMLNVKISTFIPSQQVRVEISAWLFHRGNPRQHETIWNELPTMHLSADKVSWFPLRGRFYCCYDQRDWRVGYSAPWFGESRQLNRPRAHNRPKAVNQCVGRAVWSSCGFLAIWSPPLSSSFSALRRSSHQAYQRDCPAAASVRSDQTNPSAFIMAE